MLAILELPDFSTKENRKFRADNLSGGQRQRINVAIALLSKPDIILADEPTSALDAHSAELTLNVLHNFRTPDSAIIVVSHDATVLRKVDRVINIATTSGFDV